jgi:phosphoribosyl-ATP pyrophosphohydrolase/phosphoribosyl-AMP cyclohydrolase
MNMEIEFSKYDDGLAPAIVQSSETARVLMLGYMNREALDKTIETGMVTFYSRSRQRLWTKGEISADCDRDSLLIQAAPSGPTCHTGSTSCFGDDANAPPGPAANVLYELQRVIASRQVDPEEGSYTSGLFASGINRIAQKVGEEAVELVIEAKDDDKDKFKGETADLIFHLLVLLRAKGVNLDEILELLAERRK